jgi:hypothetical protein
LSISPVQQTLPEATSATSDSAMDKEVRQQAPSRLDLTQGTRNWRQKDRAGGTHGMKRNGKGRHCLEFREVLDEVELLTTVRPRSGLTQINAVILRIV